MIIQRGTVESLYMPEEPNMKREPGLNARTYSHFGSADEYGEILINPSPAVPS